MTEIYVDIKPTRMESAYIALPFDEAKKALESRGYRIISLEENAMLRMQQGKNAYISRNGNRVREGVIYLPDRRIYLTKNSPIMQNPREATNTHRKGNEYFLTWEQVDLALQDSIELSGESILTNRFQENEITNFAFGDSAENYGLFLKDAGIKEMPVYLANPEEKPFARQMWFRNLVYRSELYSYWSLYYDSRLRGVKETSEAGSQN